jgi:CubicO group peptidase (beta-lactamase class C family)
MKTENTPGLSIAYFEKGSFEWSKCYGTMDNESKEEVTSNSIFHACSMSKMVLAICVLKLHQDNRLNIYSEVNQYLKSWKFPHNKYNKNNPVTIADLLAHQGGVSDPEGSFEPVADRVIPKNIEILQGITPYNNKEVHTSYMSQSKFDYSDAGYAVLEMLIEDTSGQKYNEFVKENIFMPLELKDTFLWSNDYKLSGACVVGHDKTGHIVNGKRAIYPNVGGAGLWTTPTDFSVIIIDLLKSFTSDSGLLLNKENANLIFSPYGCVDFAGLGVFLGVSNEKPYFISQGWGVGMQCKVITFLNDQTGAVVMMNSEPGKDQSQSIVGMVLRDILDINAE